MANSRPMKESRRPAPAAEAPLPAAPLLELTAVSKSYYATEGSPETAVLRNVNLVVGPGESLAVVGPSGSGKTTLLNIIGTLDTATSGQVRLEGRNLDGLPEPELSALRNRAIGFVFQLHHLLPQCTVLENVLIPTLARPSGRDGQNREQRALRLLERVGLAPRMQHRPGQLSGGERQRVAVVRALINEPRLLLADEPTGSLDHAAAQNLADLLVELNREEKVALVISTHSPELARRMSRVLHLQDGSLVETAGDADRLP